MMAASAWTPDDWEDWSNAVADELPPRYDGDEAQEAIILDAVKDMAARLDQVRRYLDEIDDASSAMFIRRRITEIVGEA